MKCGVISFDNKAAGEIELSEAVFGAEVRTDILARTVNWQLAGRRAGTHKTKGMGEVRGTTAKFRPQKKTGSARVGSARAPHRRGGGVVFGPVVRSHAHKLPKRVRRMAMRCVLSMKRNEGKLVVLRDVVFQSSKTSELAERLRELGWQKPLIVVGENMDKNLSRAARNLADVQILPAAGANVFDIMRCETLVLTQGAIAALEARLS